MTKATDLTLPNPEADIPARFPHLSASVVTVNCFEKEILRLDQVGFATKLSL